MNKVLLVLLAAGAAWYAAQWIRRDLRERRNGSPNAAGGAGVMDPGGNSIAEAVAANGGTGADERPGAAEKDKKPEKTL